MIVMRHNLRKIYELNVNNFNFERVAIFKYLEVGDNINENTNIPIATKK